MNQTASLSQPLDASLLNSQGQPVAYLNQSNAMTLVVTNNSGQPIVLNGPSSGTPTTLVLDCVSQVLTPSVFGAMTISLTGWQGTYDQDDNIWMLVVAVDNPPPWNVGDSLIFAVTHLQPTGQPNNGTLNLTPMSVPPLDPDPVAMQLFVQRSPDQPKDLGDSVLISTPAATVNITKSSQQVVQNTISLQIGNKSASTPLIPANVPWLDDPPTFQITFYFAPDDDPLGFNALTSQELGQKMQIALGRGSAANWKLTPQLDNPQALSWLVQPTPANHQVLGTGANALVEIDFDSLVTYLTPGPTFLYLQWYNFPGYNDGYTALFLNKTYAPMKIDRFEVSPTSVDITKGPQSVSFSWDVDNASMVQLDVVGQVPFSAYNYQYNNVQQDMTFVLTAYDIFTGTILTANQSVTTTVNRLSLLVPSGTIGIWSGSDPGQIPSSWAICDGTQGTPDLRDLFVVGTNSRDPHQPNQGTSDHQHAIQVPGVTVPTSQDGYHNHNLPTMWYERNLSCGCHTGIDVYGTNPQSTPVGGSGTHSHNITLSYPQFWSSTNNQVNRPAWISLYYVMKL